MPRYVMLVSKKKRPSVQLGRFYLRLLIILGVIFFFIFRSFSISYLFRSRCYVSINAGCFFSFCFFRCYFSSCFLLRSTTSTSSFLLNLLCCTFVVYIIIVYQLNDSHFRVIT